MSIGLATISTLLLLLPGVGFVVGVNLADKNVREVVFRNTPAEIGYVIVISLAVHLFYTVAPYIADTILPPPRPDLSNFNAAAIYVDYLKHFNKDAIPSPEDATHGLSVSLFYFLIAAVTGFLPGFSLGRLVRQRRGPWTSFFVKHRFMLDLIEVDPSVYVFARAVIKDRIDIQVDKIERPVILEGTVRDSYFGADGKLLYLVFKNFKVNAVDGSTSPALDGLVMSLPTGKAPISDQLVIDGENIALVRYTRHAFGNIDDIPSEPEEG
jgi:hypothetical protein